MAQVSSQPPPSLLPPFEGDEVREVSIKITRAGDGLSDALKVAPLALHRGDEVFYLLRGLVSQVNHKEVKPGSDDLVRVHVIVTQDITEVDADLAEPIIRRAKDVIRRKLDEASGIVPLFAANDDGIMAYEDMTEDQRVLWTQHNAGVHADGPREGCPRCAEDPVRDPDPAPKAKRTPKEPA